MDAPVRLTFKLIRTGTKLRGNEQGRDENNILH
jgi:hypothetical protein